MRILITGGAGFIGSNLVRTIIRDHPAIDVRVIDDYSTGFASNLDGLDVEIVHASILDLDRLRGASKGVDSVIHLAARPSVPRSLQDPLASHEANATGTLNVLEAARTVGAGVIVASSSSVYGANAQLPKRESMAARPMSPYAVSKLATESYAIAWGYSYGLAALAFRFFNVYGPRQAPGHAYAAVIPTFLDRLMRDEVIEIHGDGTQTRDFTHVEIVSAILIDAASRGVSHETPINLALGTQTSLNCLLELSAEVTGKQPKTAHVERRAGDVAHSSADPALLRSLFPFVPQIDLVEGLRQTYEWLASR